MKRFVIREVETLKTTAAGYICDCCCPDQCLVVIDGTPVGMGCCDSSGVSVS